MVKIARKAIVLRGGICVMSSSVAGTWSKGHYYKFYSEYSFHFRW